MSPQSRKAAVTAQRISLEMLVVILISLVTANIGAPQSCDDYCASLLPGQIGGTWNSLCNCQPQIENIKSDKRSLPDELDNPIYYEPIELNPLYDKSSTYRPFVISNPTLNNNTTNTPRLESEHKKSVKKYKRKDFSTNHDKDKHPLYLDIDILKTLENGRSSQYQVNTEFDKLNLNESDLKDCIDLHLLIHFAKNGSNELKQIWQEDHMKKYFHISDADLLMELDNKCHLPTTIVEQSLKQIEHLINTDKIGTDSEYKFDIKLDNVATSINDDEPLVSSSFLTEINSNNEDTYLNDKQNFSINHFHKDSLDKSSIDSPIMIDKHGRLGINSQIHSDNQTMVRITLNSNFSKTHDKINDSSSFNEAKLNENLFFSTTAKESPEKQDLKNFTKQNPDVEKETHFNKKNNKTFVNEIDTQTVSENTSKLFPLDPNHIINDSRFGNRDETYKMYKSNYNQTKDNLEDIPGIPYHLQSNYKSSYRKIGMNDIDNSMPQIMVIKANSESRLNMKNGTNSDNNVLNNDTDITVNRKDSNTTTRTQDDIQEQSSNNLEYTTFRNFITGSRKEIPLINNNSMLNVHSQLDEVELEKEVTTESISFTKGLTEINDLLFVPTTEKNTSYVMNTYINRAIHPNKDIPTKIQIPKIEVVNETDSNTIAGIEEVLVNLTTDPVLETDVTVNTINPYFEKGIDEHKISGNLYFMFKNLLIPMRFVQASDGKLDLSLDATSFCNKINKDKDGGTDDILTTLCKCIRQ